MGHSVLGVYGSRVIGEASRRLYLADRSATAFNPAHYSCGALAYDDYAVFGLVLVQFSDLEKELSFLVWSLLADAHALAPHRCDRREADRHQTIGAIVTAALPFRRMIDVAVGLTVDRFGTSERTVEVMRGIAQRCGAIEEQRNRMVHSWWPLTAANADGDCEAAGRFKYGLSRRVGLTVSQDHSVNCPALIELADEIQSLKVDIAAFMEETWPTFGPLAAD